MMKHYRKVFFVLVPVLLVLDQVTKAMIRGQVTLHEKIVVIPGFFNITHATNKGAAWGIFRNLPEAQRMAFFAVVTLLAFVMILGYYRQLGPKDRLLAVSLSSIFAGAAGNFVDRLIFREVTDFLQFYVSQQTGLGGWLRETFNTSSWPSFNVADICINVGVGLFIWHVLFIETRRKKEEGAEAPAPAPVPEDEPAPTP